MTAPDDATWQPGPARPLAGWDAIDVWRADLDVEPVLIDHMRGSLSPDERARADRFRFPRDADRFVAGRGILRDILGRYVAVAPAALAFRYGPQGKPELETPAGTGVGFNVSHAGGVLLVAVGLRRSIGIDVERDRPGLDLELAARYFSPGELAVLRGLPDARRRRAFLDCWTRKEAYIKARGQGLSLPLDSFDVSLGPDEPARLLADRVDPGAVAGWSLRALPMPAGYAAALAAQGLGWRLRLWEWPGRPDAADRGVGADAIG